MRLLGLDYEQKNLATADQLEEIKEYNPVGRVPALELDEEEVLIDSSAIIDYLNETAPADKKLVPISGPERWAVLRQTSIALGVAEKAVALAYERNRRPEDKVWDEWVARLSGQLEGGLDALERSLQGQDWLVGDEMTLADVTAVCAFDSAAMIAPELATEERYPRLASLSERCGELAAFSETKPSR
jgi:glutathione S-transferase